jgi:hypothetical protein
LWRNVIVAHCNIGPTFSCASAFKLIMPVSGELHQRALRPGGRAAQPPSDLKRKVSSGLLFGKHPTFSRPLDQRKRSAGPRSM